MPECARGRNPVPNGHRDTAGKPPAAVRASRTHRNRLGEGTVPAIPGMASIKRGFGHGWQPNMVCLKS